MATNIPAPIAEIWNPLVDEVLVLHNKWQIFRQLYGTSPAEIDILQRTAATVFGYLQIVMIHDTQLGLSKLGDPAVTRGGRTNLTLGALLDAVSNHGNPALADQMRPLIAAYQAACEKIRTRRDTWIAHFDRATIQSKSVKPLENASRDEIEGALNALREVFDCVEMHYDGQSTAYEHCVMQNDGPSLLRYLKQGLRYQQLVEANQIPRDDLRSNFK